MLTEEQLAIRRTGIGGSDAAAAVGLGQRYTARELYHIKRGELDPPDLGLDDEAWVGQELERTLRKRYRFETGRRVSLLKETQRHPDFSFMLAHYDGLVGETRGFEGKVRFSTKGWGPTGTDQVPDDEYLQCLHYLTVSGRRSWDLQVLFAGVEFRRYTIPRDPVLIDKLVDGEAGFWDHVVEGRVPALDFEHPSTPALVRRLYHAVDGRFLTVGQEVDPSVVHWHEVYQDAKDRADEYNKVADVARAHILAEMRTAARLMLPDGSMYVRKTYDRPSSVQEARRITYLRHEKAPKSRR